MPCMSADPTRVLHFADIHIGMENYGRIDPATGINQRVLDFVSRLAEIVSAAIEQHADCVIFAGDAFKTRDPNQTYQREFARQIKRLSDAGIATVLLVGNHDTPIIEKRATSIDIFGVLDVPHVIVAKDEALHTVQTRNGPLQVATIPWPQRQRLMAGDDTRGLNIEQLDSELAGRVATEIDKLAAQADPEIPAILTGHFSVAGAVFGSERQVMIGRDAILPLASLTHPVWNYVALGHIHKHQDVNKGATPPVVYSGSLERIDFGEEHEAKGYCWIELTRQTTMWRFVPINVRRFLTLTVDATDDGDEPTDAVLREIDRHDVTGCIVKVRVKLLQSQEPMLRPREIEDALQAAHMLAGISKDITRETRQRIGLQNAESLTPRELLVKYLESKGLPQAEVERLARAADELM
jgi:DNA repair protein SbcD/Mre11